jgi:hypothetical protein
MMAKLHPQKNYEFIKGDDWFYDRAIFDRLSPEIETITIPMSEGEYKAFEAIRKMCHIELGDDYAGPLPRIEIVEEA